MDNNADTGRVTLDTDAGPAGSPDAAASTGFDAVVLAGGAATRLGGVDKPGLVVGDRSMLQRAVDACAGARRTVVVGPRREGVSGVSAWVREDPPGGGPTAALCAALPGVRAPVAVVAAADLPFLRGGTVAALVRVLHAAPDADGVVLTDARGRDQTLLAAYRADALRGAARALGPAEGAPLRALLAPLRLVRLPDADGASFDCDTWDRVAEARIRLHGVQGG